MLLEVSGTVEAWQTRVDILIDGRNRRRPVACKPPHTVV